MSIQSRIVRGIGYGAVAVSMLGFSLQAIETPLIGAAAGKLFTHPTTQQLKRETLENRRKEVEAEGITAKQQPEQKVVAIVQEEKETSKAEITEEIEFASLGEGGGQGTKRDQGKEIVEHGLLKLASLISEKFETIREIELPEEDAIMILLLLEEV